MTPFHSRVLEILNSPDFARLGEMVKLNVLEAIANTEPDDIEGRERLYMLLQVQSLYARQLLSIANDGEALRKKALRDAALVSRTH